MSTWLVLVMALFGYMCFWYLISIIVKRNDVADIGWGLGFILLAWLSFSLENMPSHAIMTNILITIWGLRLSLHIGTRLIKQQEDFRYATWRKEWKHFHLRSFLQVFMLQGSLLFIVAVPIIRLNISEEISSPAFTWLGTLLWLTGFLFETVADLQLRKFKAAPDNRGRLLTSGLWKYSRHPNYFGDAVQWWGIFVIALAYTGSWWTVISPILMTYLLRYVSGVPMLEKKYADHPEFQDYARKTPVFTPFFRK